MTITSIMVSEPHHRNKDYNDFRYYSRHVLKTPGDLSHHERRIEIARNFTVNEPLQGALADMFYGCWFEIPYYGAEILKELEDRLIPRIYNAFEAHIQKKKYICRYSELATRWSVLVTPSLNVADHHLRISSDDARQIAYQVVEKLIQAKSEDDDEAIQQIEHAFFSHCIGCFDRIGFSLVWFRLAKHGWQFDSQWTDCQRYLEMSDKHIINTPT